MLKDKIIEIILWLGFVAATCILTGPSFLDSLYNIRQVNAIGTYTSDINALDEIEIEDIRIAVEDYNEKIVARQADTPFYYQGEHVSDEEYDRLLTLGNEKNIMGYVEVPSANIYLPIAHGTNTKMLTYEAGHMYGTSIPIGGPSTHAVIAAHTGLKSADLFTHLTDTAVGDVFYIHILNEILEYTVDQIEVVLPEDEDPYLQIVPEEDYVTLYTCTPYGVNDHRLLVRGTRTGTVINANEAGGALQQQRMNRRALLHTVLFGAIPVLVLFAGGFIVFKKKKDDPGSTETGQCGGEPDGQTQEDGTGPENEDLPDAPETAEGESEPSSQQEMTDGQQNIQNKEEKI